MSQQLINNQEGGKDVRALINENFTELYGAIVPPIRTPGISANTQIQIPANCVVVGIYVIDRAGAPNVKLGITGGGEQIMEATDIAGFTPIKPDQFFGAVGNIFATISGGTVDITIIVIPNLF